MAAVRAAARPFEDSSDLDALIDRARHARIVLIGEASHGTEEFYALRAALTRRLIEAHGFAAVALEADWPDTFRVHRYVTGRGGDPSAAAALGGFRRFPQWMWRNEVTREFVDWMRGWNATQLPGRAAGIFGLDLYSLHASIDAVLAYLEGVDPEAAKRARERYSCFEHFGRDPQHYGLASSYSSETCEQEVVDQLLDLQRKSGEFTRIDGQPMREEFFSAEQNARLVLNAERYYRSMFRGRDESWNLRDEHMAQTLDAIRGRLPAGSGIVVWAHNSHLGDARATQMTTRGELNLGQLARQRYGAEVYAVGLSTYAGSVRAASDWDAPSQVMSVQPGLAGSYEELFHNAGMPRLWLDLAQGGPAAQATMQPRLQRAIGVIYRPQTERWSHYFEACLPLQFDALIHIDRTSALVPLESEPGERSDETPETYPTAL